MSINLIILGAGAPHAGTIPAAVNKAPNGTSILEWQLSVANCNPKSSYFVAGFGSEQLVNTNIPINVIFNKDWKTTKSAYSFLLAPFEKSTDYVVTYGDILFRNNLIEELLSSDIADVVLAWDSKWSDRFEPDDPTVLQQREKVCITDSIVFRCGSDIPLDLATGEFIGVAYFTSKAIDFLSESGFTSEKQLQTASLADCIEILRLAGFKIKGHDVAGDWAELNDSSDIARFVLGTKADTLARLKNIIQLSSIYDQFTFTTFNWLIDRTLILNAISAAYPNQNLIVRSSSTAEDAFDSSNAGGFTSVLNVNTLEKLEEAIDSVVESYGECDSDQQILIQPMLSNAKLSGVILTRTLNGSAPWITVNYETAGQTHSVTSGEASDHKTLVISRDTDSKILDKKKYGLPANLLSIIDEIEHLLGYDQLDIEFGVDSNDNVYIFQVRPLTAPKSRFSDASFFNEINNAKKFFASNMSIPPNIPTNNQPIFGIMPDWNPAEIIGTAPTELAFSLYEHLLLNDIWAQQRYEFGYLDVRPATLLHKIAGKPYIDVRASFASFIPSTISESLASRLLKFYIDWLKEHPELHDKVEFEVIPTCYGPNFSKWSERFATCGGFSKEEIFSLEKSLFEITNRAFARCSHQLKSIEILSSNYKSSIEIYADQPAKLVKFLIEDCKAHGTLAFAHLARCGFIAITLLNEGVTADILSQEARDDFLSSINSITNELSKDAYRVNTGSLKFTEFTDKYGHLRPGTYDISSPRYDSNPELFLIPIIKNAKAEAKSLGTGDKWNTEKESFFNSLRSLGFNHDSRTIESFLRDSIAGREYSKFVFTRNLSTALELISTESEKRGLTREQISNLSIHEAYSFISSMASAEIFHSSNLENTISERLSHRKLCEMIPLPSIISACSDLEIFSIEKDEPNFIGNSSIIGKPLELSSSASVAMKGNIDNSLVCIKSADPGYDWIFSHNVAGLITLYGGANSHMAIRCAEFGMLAAIGVGESMYTQVCQSNLVELSPRDRVLRSIK